MEIIKQSETYKISEVRENGWEMAGQFVCEVNNSFSIYFSVSVTGELSNGIGTCNYTKYDGQDMASINYSVSEEDRDEFTQYADTVIDQIINRINTKE